MPRKSVKKAAAPKSARRGGPRAARVVGPASPKDYQFPLLGRQEIRETLVSRQVGKRGDVFRGALLERARVAVAEIINRAPDELIASALAEPDAFASLAKTVSSSVFGNPEVTDDDRIMLAASAEGARYKNELLKRAGGVWSSEQLAAALKRTRQAIHEGRERNRYFAIPAADGLVFPKLQVTKDGLLPGLKEFLAAFDVRDPWTQLMVLLEPSARLGGKSPLQALRAGDRDGAVAVAAAYGGHGA